MSTFLFMPESAYGPTNNCIGIAHVLAERGHHIVFAAESSWLGKLEPYGFVEDLVDLAPASTEEAEAGKFWTDYIRDTASLFRLPTIEQIETFILPTWQALMDGARYCQPQLEAIVDRARPDVVVEDNVCAFPALMTAGAAFVRIVSCNPLEMKGRGLPPTFSGYAAGDESGWAEFRNEYARVHAETWCAFNEWVVDNGAPPLPELEFIHESEHLNLYVYPEAVDYRRKDPLGRSWHRLDSSVRETEGGFDLPEELSRVARAAGGAARASAAGGAGPAGDARAAAAAARAAGDGALVYLSLGSLGSADVELMKRLVSALAETPHRYVVSKGPLADSYDLADNMWGVPQVPQTRVLPLVDLAITHGGNNTTTECFHFGVPTIALPLFWDQYDNAQRVEETGFGRRLATYEFEPAELRRAVDELLGDRALRNELARTGRAIRSRDGLHRAADLLEQLALRG